MTLQAKLNILRILSDVYKLSIVEAFFTFESKALREKDENVLLIPCLKSLHFSLRMTFFFVEL